MEDIKTTHVSIKSIRKVEWSLYEGRIWLTVNGTEYSGNIDDTEGSLYPLKVGFSFIRDQTNGYNDAKVKFIVVD